MNVDPLASKTKFCKPMKCIVLEDVILYLPLFKTSLLAFTFLQCAIAALSASGRSGQSSDAPKSAAFTTSLSGSSGRRTSNSFAPVGTGGVAAPDSTSDPSGINLSALPTHILKLSISKLDGVSVCI